MNIWFILKIFWSGIALSALTVTPVILWKAKGVLNWRKSIRAELAALKIRPGQERTDEKKANEIIIQQCNRIFNSNSPGISELRDIKSFVSSIAACYHPGAKYPELQLTMASFLRGLDKLLYRFDLILHRPGFGKLRGVTLRNINNIYKTYLRFTKFPPAAWYLRNADKIRRLSMLRLFVYIDPFIALAFLSRRLTILILTKYLLADIYLFIGKLAVEAYGNQGPVGGEEIRKDFIKTLIELGNLEDQEAQPEDAALLEIRNRFTGISSLFGPNPTYSKWRDSVFEAAEIIAGKHFPEAESPLNEAALGPLLERTGSWLQKLSKGDKLPFIKRFYHIRLESLYRTKDLVGMTLPRSVHGIMMKSYKGYSWLKWPFLVYRITKRFSPWKTALEVGWIAGKKTILIFICTSTLDTACREIDLIYGRSKELAGGSNVKDVKLL